MDTEPTTALDPPAIADWTPPPYVPEVTLAPVPASTHTPPRIRWAGIVWGLVFAFIAALSLWVLASASRREAIRDWVLTLSPDTVAPVVVVGIAVLVIGAALLIVGGIALLRRLSFTVER
jgi:hypothetical protein